MNTNNNLYTIIYAAVLVVVVAVILAFASSLLKERQQRNIEIERKEMILRSVQLGTDQAARANDKDSYIEAEYAKYIKDSSINEQGKDLILYICTVENGERFYVIPLRGVGLWGPVWGYISLKGDFNTVYGATFDHKSETPGLGAEITTPMFYKQFENKTVFDKAGNFVSIQVVKGGADLSNGHEVDAISGGTITSKAVEDMLFKNIKEYTTFFAAKLKEAQERAADERAAEAALQVQLSDSTAVAPELQVNIK